MPEHIEVETEELQKQIEELHEEGQERREEAAANAWVRWVGLSTAILAVFAAVAALQSGSLINEALIHQIKASDTWNEYQAARQKDHVYTLAINTLADQNPNDRAMRQVLAAPPPPKAEGEKPAAPAEKAALADSPFLTKTAAQRAAEYRSKVNDERGKEASRSELARDLEGDAAKEIAKQHYFEYAVAVMQVAIALSAIAALARARMVWYFSMVAGAIGIVCFFIGWL
jgi:hypothetical protein